jgi:hypothetical protein
MIMYVVKSFCILADVLHSIYAMRTPIAASANGTAALMPTTSDFKASLDELVGAGAEAEPVFAAMVLELPPKEAGDSVEDRLDGDPALGAVILGVAITLAGAIDTTETPVTVEIPSLNKKDVSVARSR